MSTRIAAISGIVLLWAGTPAFAHRLDEYLQATTIAVEKDHIVLHVRLTPGVEVFPQLIAVIDPDSDGVISEAEQRAYAERVRGDLSLSVDGQPLRLRLVSSSFAKVEDMKEGLGDIALAFEAPVPAGGAARKLTFENRHQSRISVYLVNCLLPDDPDIRVTAHSRNYEQSLYRLDYAQGRVPPVPTASALRSGLSPAFRMFLLADALVLLGWLGLLGRRYVRTVLSTPRAHAAVAAQPAASAALKNSVIRERSSGV